MMTEKELHEEQSKVAEAKKVIAKYLSRLVKENLEEDQLKEEDSIADEAGSLIEDIDSVILDMVQTECLVESEDDET